MDEKRRQFDFRGIAAGLALILAVTALGTRSAEATVGVAVVMDKTGSMAATTTSCGASMPRCDCAIQKAQEFVNLRFAENPAVEISVIHFLNPPTQVLDFSNSQSAVLAALSGSCTSNTPMADAICNGLSELSADYPPNMRRLGVFTDGEENASTITACAGPDDTLGGFPYSAGSWQANTHAQVVSTSLAKIDITFFGEIPPISLAPEVTDFDFFKTLVSDVGGTFTVCDAVACSAIVIDLPKVPTLTAPGVAAAVGLVVAGLYFARRRASVQAASGRG